MPAPASATPEGPSVPEAAAPTSVTGEVDPELEWLRTTYRGDGERQLTVRALAMGGAIGAVMCLANLYQQLKTGLATGVALVACLVSFSVHGALMRIAPRWFGPRLTLLEANAMQTTASAAGYATGSALAGASAAYLLLSGHHVPFWLLFAWTLSTSALGAFFAIPLKRQVINREQLRFPSGLSAATLLRTLHEGDASNRGARALGLSGLAAGLLAVLRSGFGFIPSTLAIPGAIRGALLSELTFGVETSLALPGLGALMGTRITLSMALGAGACFGVLAPALHASGVLTALDYPSITAWSLWPGIALMVSASLTQIALSGQMFSRGLGGLVRAMRARGGPARVDPMAAVEVPRSWFWLGLLPLSAATLALSRAAYGVPLGLGAGAVALAFVFALITCRITGETDVTPPLAQLTQLVYGAVAPQSLVTNVMAAGITGNTSAVAADLLTDLKSGHLLGANPRRQFLAQLAGCVIGAAVAVPFFYLLAPDAAALGGERFPAPVAKLTLGIASVLSGGLSALHPTARWAAAVGAVLGIVLALGEALLPPRWSARIPSALGLGLAFILPASMTLSLLAGSLGAAWLARARPAFAQEITAPAASGLIAGEYLVGAVLAAVAVLSG